MLIGNISEQRDLNLITFVAVPSDFVSPLKLLSQEFLFHFLSFPFLILRILHSCHKNVSFLSQTSYKLQGTLFPKPDECLSCHFSCLTSAGTYFWLLPPKISSHDAPFIHLHWFSWCFLCTLQCPICILSSNLSMVVMSLRTSHVSLKYIKSDIWYHFFCHFTLYFVFLLYLKFFFRNKMSLWCLNWSFACTCG